MDPKSILGNVLLVILAIVTFPVGLMLALGIKITQKIGILHSLRIFVMFIAGGLLALIGMATAGFMPVGLIYLGELLIPWTVPLGIIFTGFFMGLFR